MAATRSAPRGLGRGGRALWRQVTAAHSGLSPAALRVLADACHEADVVDRLQEALAGAEPVVTGSMGQQVPHPLLGELRQHRGLLGVLLKSLRLPDGDDGAAERAKADSDAARAAARARWDRRKGDGG